MKPIVALEREVGLDAWKVYYFYCSFLLFGLVLNDFRDKLRPA